MAKITFVTQSSRLSDDIGYDPSRLVNVYPEVGPQNAKGPVLLRSVPGRASFADTSQPIFRAMHYANNALWVISGGDLFSISEGGNLTNVVTVGDSDETYISSGTEPYITMAIGGVYYVWDGATLITPGSGRLSSVGSVATIDHYTILTEKDGDEFEWTTLADPTTRNALYFATNEARTDITLRAMADKSYIWFFGTESTEIWYNTGQSGADAFTRLGGGVIDTGLLAANLVTRTESGIFFVGDDRVAYMAGAGGLNAVSTPAVNQALDAETPTHCFYYEDRGHRFCCIRFANRPAWVYDAAVGLWHERSSGVNLGAWDVVAASYAWGRYYCATNSGVIYKFERTNDDVTSALKRTMVSSSLYMEGEQFSVDELELLGEFGESATETTITLRISRDKGRTFGAPIYRSSAAGGGRELRAVYRALGRQRDFVAEISVTDATDMNFYSDVNVRVG